MAGEVVLGTFFVVYPLSVCFLRFKLTLLWAICEVEAGILPPASGCPRGSFVRYGGGQGGWAEKEEGTCVFLSASSSPEGHLSNTSLLQQQH